MLTLLLGAALGWLVTGVADHFAIRRAVRIAYERGVEDGVGQVSSW